MTNAYEQFNTEDRRLVILRLLDADSGYSMNASVLQSALESVAAHTVSRDVVLHDIEWLQEVGLVTREDVGNVVIARLTGRGSDVANGRTTVPGVKRPRPD